MPKGTKTEKPWQRPMLRLRLRLRLRLLLHRREWLPRPRLRWVPPSMARVAAAVAAASLRRSPLDRGHWTRAAAARCPHPPPTTTTTGGRPSRLRRPWRLRPLQLRPLRCFSSAGGLLSSTSAMAAVAGGGCRACLNFLRRGPWAGLAVAAAALLLPRPVPLLHLVGSAGD